MSEYVVPAIAFLILVVPLATLAGHFFLAEKNEPSLALGERVVLPIGDHLRAGTDMRAAAVAAMQAGCVAAADPGLLSRDTIIDTVKPLVMPKSYLDQQRTWNGQPVEGPKYVRRALRSKTLEQIYAADLGTQVLWVTEEDLERTAIDRDELERMAIANLERDDDFDVRELRFAAPSGDSVLIGVLFGFKDELSSSRALMPSFRETVAEIFRAKCILGEKYRIAVPSRNSIWCLWEKAETGGVRAGFDEDRHPISPDLHHPDDFLPA